MADTVRSLDDFLNASTGLFKDNTAGDISAQDLRDFTISAYQPSAIPPGGRLTTESGVGVSTSDRTSQSALYYTPFVHDRIGLYDGTSWTLHAFTERSLALSSLTSGLNYDVFLYDNAGTLTLSLTAWSSDTARATALTTQDGVYVLTGSTTHRYLGTIRTTGTTTTEDSGSTANAGGATPKRFIWNAYNQVLRPFRRVDTTASWTLNTGTWRAARGSNSNRVELVVGLTGRAIDLTLLAAGQYTSTNDSGRVGIGEDSTTTAHANCLGMYMPLVSSSVPMTTKLQTVVPLGYHYYQWLETDNGFGAGMTFYGSDGFNISGIAGVWAC